MRILLSHQDRQSANRLRGEIQSWEPTWEVEIATSAEETLARASSGEYQAILWEISTPGAAGLLSVRQLRAAAPLTVLVVTASPGVEPLAAQALGAGADAYLIRRTTWSQELLALLSQVESLGRRRRELAELERELRRLQDQQTLLLDSVPQPVMLISPDGGIAACNQAAAELTGRPREELVGSNFSALLLSSYALEGLLACLADPGVSLPVPGPGLVRCWREDQEVKAELLLQEKADHYRLCTVSLRRLVGAPSVLVTIYTDREPQTERTERPAASAEVIWQSPNLYVLLVDSQGRIVRVGAGLGAWLGELGEEIIGRSVAELLEPAVFARIQAALESAGQFAGEVNLGPRTGAPRTCVLEVTKVGEEGAGFSLWVAVPLRETEQREHTLQLERALASLAEAIKRLESVHEPHDLPEQILEAAERLLRFDAGLCRLSVAWNGGCGQIGESSRGLAPSSVPAIAERLEALLRSGRLPRQALVFSDLEEYCRRSGESSLQAALAAEGLASAVWIPVSTGGEPVGFVLLGARRREAFPPWWQRVLDLFGAEIGRAASAATLFYQTQTSASLAQQLLRISVALNSRGELEDVLRRVAEAAVNLAAGDCCWVEVLDEQAQQFVSTFHYCPDPQLRQDLYVDVHKVAWQAVEQQAPTQAEVQPPGGPRYGITAVPLRVEGRVVGVMTVALPNSRRMSATVFNALQVLATQAAAAVRNMQLLALADQQTKRMEAAAIQAREEEARARTVLQAAASVTESRDLEDTLAQIARSAAQEIGFERVRIFLADHQAGVLQGRAEAYADGSVLNIGTQEVPLRAGADVLADVALSSAPYMLYSGEALEGEPGGFEQLFVPVRWQGELMGIITADNRSSQRPISPQQIRLLRALATLAAVAVERARMDEVRHTLVSAVSHELRRPLASIRAYNELLLDGDAGPINEEQRTYLRRVEEGCQRLAGMIEELLDWSKLRAGRITVDRKPADLRQTVQEVADELSARARQAEVNLSVEVEEALPAVETDPALLEQVLSNLVDNAIKFNRPGGRVTIRLHGEPEAAVIEVEDTGPGIPPEYHSKIFEEFERGPRELHRQTEGAGLGLSIAARLTEYLGGSLRLDSKVGEGSTFSVRLPYAHR